MALRRIIPRRRPILPVPRAFFSSSPPFPPPPPPTNDPDAAHSPSSSPSPNPGAPWNPSHFQDIKDRLRASPTSPSPRRAPANLPRPNPAGGASPSPQTDLLRMLREFRSTSGAPSPSTPRAAPGAAPSFMSLLKDRVAEGPNAGRGAPGFDSIRESLKRSPQQTPHRSNLFMTPDSNIFNPELQRNSKAVGTGKEEKDSTIALLRYYSYEELGKRLGELRPADAAKDGKEWFSLKELQGRIAKLAELEKQENRPSRMAEFRHSIANLKNQEKPALPVNITSLLNLGGQLTLDYMNRPPQEELLEKYFHPDHMSSEEKMKLELQRVRDEFKMSENDCGSARVQIAQLTLKIKHLSAVLHKKDKHSRKGLQEMVQKRKKYLKYLRRTDWDSYCLVLSKLGLRDVPEYKAPDYKSKATTKAKSKKSKSKSKSKKRKVKA